MQKLTQYANYNGDVTHIVGESFTCPRLAHPQSTMLRWVATDAVYNFSTDRTRVEFDGEEI
jgi:hypothetical protein